LPPVSHHRRNLRQPFKSASVFTFQTIMENHIFSDPVPFPDASIQPCWRVDVFRKGVDEPVGCLEVHPQSLPPRKGKKNKILWKLPDNLNGSPPRFGGLEKARLWELFKQQKKERRKSRKKVEEDESEYGGGGGGEEENSSNGTALHKNGGTPGNDQEAPQRPVEPPLVQSGALPTPSPAHTRAAPPSSVPSSTAPAPPPPPPPGFGMSRLSINDTNKTPSPQHAENDVERELDRGGTTHSQAQVSPPNLPGPETRNDEPQTQFQQQQQQSPEVVSTELSFMFGSLTAQEILSLPPPSLSSIIGSHVAKVLIHSLTTPGQLSFWLAHYHARAQKLLSFGTAQAVALTAADRQQQWESLLLNQPTNAVSPSTASWDCQGWTVQAMLNNDEQTAGGVQTPSLLIVLNGRTLQRQEILTYHLTLILRPVPAESLDNGQQQQHPPTFQIHNEILSLTRTSI